MSNLLHSLLIPAAICSMVASVLPNCSRAQDSPLPAKVRSTFADALTFDRAAINRDGSAPASYAPMLKKVRPAIVTIFTGVETVQQTNYSRDELMMMRFYGLPLPDRSGDGKHRWQQLGVGSGVIVTKDGYIITNRHVVLPPDLQNMGMSQSQYLGAMQLRVTMPGREGHVEAELIDVSPDKDIAVIKISGTDLPAARLADSSLVEVGDRVFALGAPFGINETVTSGIISAKRNDEVLEGFEKQELIQTDASINPGNSGGPLVDVEGRVIGINTAIYSRTGSNLGIGFAIPINQAVAAADALSRPRGFLGVSLKPVNQRAARNFGFRGGAFVESVDEPSPGARAGLRPGDVILSFHGKPVLNDEELRTRIASLSPGAKVKAEVFRDQKRGEFTITLGERPNNFKLEQVVPTSGEAAQASLLKAPAETKGEPPAPAAPVAEAKHGMSLRMATAEDRQVVSLPEGVPGICISDVKPNSPSAKGGLKSGQVILKINEVAPDSAEAAEAALNKAHGAVLLQVKDTDAERLMVIEMP